MNVAIQDSLVHFNFCGKVHLRYTCDAFLLHVQDFWIKCSLQLMFTFYLSIENVLITLSEDNILSNTPLKIF